MMQFYQFNDRMKRLYIVCFKGTVHDNNLYYVSFLQGWKPHMHSRVVLSGFQSMSDKMLFVYFLFADAKQQSPLHSLRLII